MFDCVILVPYRNRPSHLDYFLRHTAPLLEQHYLNSKIVILEQDWTNQLFNRGKLLNVGVKEYDGKAKYIITNDIDVNPLVSAMEKYYTKNLNINEIDGICTPNWNTLGCIIKMNLETMIKINGFPNDIWGWGAEDRALQLRAEHFGCQIYKQLYKEDSSTSEYFKEFDDIKDKISDNNIPNIHRYDISTMNETDKIHCIYGSGINNIEYQILDKQQLSSNVEWILVKI